MDLWVLIFSFAIFCALYWFTSVLHLGRMDIKVLIFLCILITGWCCNARVITTYISTENEDSSGSYEIITLNPSPLEIVFIGLGNSKWDLLSLYRVADKYPVSRDGSWKDRRTLYSVWRILCFSPWIPCWEQDPNRDRSHPSQSVLPVA